MTEQELREMNDEDLKKELQKAKENLESQLKFDEAFDHHFGHYSGRSMMQGIKEERVEKLEQEILRRTSRD